MEKQQVSYESALEVYRTRAEELFHKSTMLEARVLDLEGQLKQQSGPEPGPVAASEYLGSTPSQE